jgi:hypothetical protein
MIETREDKSTRQDENRREEASDCGKYQKRTRICLFSSFLWWVWLKWFFQWCKCFLSMSIESLDSMICILSFSWRWKKFTAHQRPDFLCKKL